MLLPGFFLALIFNFWSKNNLLEKIISWFILSFIWNMFLTAIGLLTNLNIGELVIFYFIGFFVLVVVSKVKIPDRFNLEWKINFNFFKENFIWILPIILAIFTIYVAQSHGAIFEEESFFHLAIMKKAVSGQALSIKNLNFIGTNIFHPVYSFPLWHIFLALISHICKTDIFIIWQAALIPLSIFVIIIWAWLLSLIFQNRTLSALSLSFFLITILLFNHSYLFERLAVPNTLGLFILIPLLFGLSLKYIFEQNNQKILTIFWLLLFFTSLIHSLQFIYFGLIYSFFVLTFGIFSFKNENLKILFKKSLAILASYFIIVLVFFLIFWHWHLFNFNQELSEEISQPTFNNLFLFSKITFLIFPVLIFLIRKNIRLVFIFSLFLVLPIIYFFNLSFIQILFLHIFGSVFLSRLDSYVTWDFAIWGVCLTLFLSYLDSIITEIKWQKILNIGLSLVFLIEIFLEQKFHFISNLYNKTFVNLNLTNLLNNYYWFLLIIIIAIISLICLWQTKINFNNFIKDHFKNYLIIFLLATVILFFFFSPAYIDLAQKPEKYDADHTKLELDSIGGQNMIDFVNSKIPAKSVILANDYTTDILPLLTDNFMAAYPRSTNQKKIDSIFTNISFENKLNLIKKYKIQFIITPETNVLEIDLVKHPENFSKIYDQNQTRIYQVKY